MERHRQNSSNSAAAAPAAAPAVARNNVASAFASGASQDQRFDTELVCTLLESYFGIVKKNIRDSVPKAVMHFLVMKTAESLHNHLVQTMYNDDALQKLLQESPEVTEKRANAKQNLDVLEHASKIISEIRSVTF